MTLDDSDEIAFQDIFMVCRDVFEQGAFTVYENRYDKDEFDIKV